MKKLIIILFLFPLSGFTQFKSDKDAEQYKSKATLDLIYSGEHKTKEADFYMMNSHFVLFKTGKWISDIDNIDWKNYPKIGVAIGDTIYILYKNHTWIKK